VKGCAGSKVLGFDHPRSLMRRSARAAKKADKKVSNNRKELERLGR
jgi:hypothetical protein